jgi:hypothetical protein
MKKYDLVVKVGEYQKDGQTKARNKNIGVVMENDKGMYIIMDRTFNPAGVPNPDNKESVFVSMYEAKPNDGYQKHNEDKSNGYQPQEDLDDSMPF